MNLREITLKIKTYKKLGTDMYARIPVTKANFESQKKIIKNAMKLEKN